MKSLYESKPELLKHHQKGIGHTALHWSSSSGWIPCVEWLLENGASVHELNSSDATPLHAAAGGGHLAIVQRLLKAGADPKLKDDDGNTPSALAASRGHTEVAAAIK